MTLRDESHLSALRTAFARRSKAFHRFAAWEMSHPRRSTPGDAVSAATWLYDLLPAESRVRPIETAGVQALHRLLASLGARR